MENKEQTATMELSEKARPFMELYKEARLFFQKIDEAYNLCYTGESYPEDDAMMCYANEKSEPLVKPEQEILRLLREQISTVIIDGIEDELSFPK